MHLGFTNRGVKCCLNILAVEAKFGSTKLACAIRGALTLAVLSALLLITFQPAQAQTETVLYSFTGIPDGSYPISGLAVDKSGNLYGTTYQGGANGQGTVFKATPTGTETVLYSFGTQSGDGANPLGPVVLDKKGNLYGTTYVGGAYGCGTVFKLTPKGAGTVLYSFGNVPDGCGAVWESGLALDSKGNLYGTTWAGGAFNQGTVFKLTPKGTETVFYSFGSQSGDGVSPAGAVALDKLGNLYGITLYSSGGAKGGTVWKLTPAGVETVLFDFAQGGALGAYPYGGVIRDAKGNLYGTTNYGGTSNAGIAYKITQTGTESVLYNFGSQAGDGLYPVGLALGAKGNLYGTCQEGGTTGAGTVFKLTPKGVETVLWSFGGQPDGYQPWAAPILDKLGNIYGTTLSGGGASSFGTVFKLVP